MTLPIALNTFANPVAGSVPDVIAFNVRGQDNILIGAVNQIITALGGGGLPFTVPASIVSAGSFGSGTGGGNYTFPAGLTLKTLHIAGSSSGAVSFVATASAGSATYVLPGADGSNNYVLTTDGSGNLSWSNKTGGTPGSISSINGDSSAAQTLAAGGGVTIVDAGPVHTYALDLNYAPTYTTKITAAAFATSGTVAISGNTGPTTPSGNGQANLSTQTTSGLILIGQGSVQDFVLFNKSVNPVVEVPTGTATWAMQGDATIAGDLNVNGGQFTVDHATGNTVIAGSLTAASATIHGNVLIDTGGTLTLGGDVLPATDNAYTIGTASGPKRIKDIQAITATFATSVTTTTAILSAITGSITVSGTVTLPNTVAYQAKDSGATARAGFVLTGANTWHIGDIAALGFPATLSGNPVTLDGPVVTTSSINAASLPTSAGLSGTLWVDTAGGLNIVKRA